MPDDKGYYTETQSKCTARYRQYQSLGSIEPKESLLIIAPHPDDEVIGCAGLIQRSLNKGNNVYVIILTKPEKHHITDAVELLHKN